jgi:hypothetical protein
MNTMYNKTKLFSLLVFVTLFSLCACSKSAPDELSEEEKQEVISIEETADKIDAAVEELDSAINELDEIEDLLK